MVTPSAATFQFLFRKFVIDPSIMEGGESRPSLAKMLFSGIALNGLLATPIMMAQMALLQLVSGDTQVGRFCANRINRNINNGLDARISYSMDLSVSEVHSYFYN